MTGRFSSGLNLCSTFQKEMTGFFRSSCLGDEVPGFFITERMSHSLACSRSTRRAFGFSSAFSFATTAPQSSFDCGALEESSTDFLMTGFIFSLSGFFASCSSVLDFSTFA